MMVGDTLSTITMMVEYLDLQCPEIVTDLACLGLRKQMLVDRVVTIGLAADNRKQRVFEALTVAEARKGQLAKVTQRYKTLNRAREIVGVLEAAKMRQSFMALRKIPPLAMAALCDMAKDPKLKMRNALITPRPRYGIVERNVTNVIIAALAVHRFDKFDFIVGIQDAIFRKLCERPLYLDLDGRSGLGHSVVPCRRRTSV